MNSKQGPRVAGMRTPVNAFGRRHLGAEHIDDGAEAAA